VDPAEAADGGVPRERLRLERPSFSEEKEAKRLFYAGSWALGSSSLCPSVVEVFWFFFSKKNCLP
jgi:hypothetical protein